mgnify:CR=1 FL=1
MPICQAINPLLELIFPKSPDTADFECWDFSLSGQARHGKRVEVEDLGEVIRGERFDGSFHGRASL